MRHRYIQIFIEREYYILIYYKLSKQKIHVPIIK